MHCWCLNPRANSVPTAFPSITTPAGGESINNRPPNLEAALRHTVPNGRCQEPLTDAVTRPSSSAQPFLDAGLCFPGDAGMLPGRVPARRFHPARAALGWLPTTGFGSQTPEVIGSPMGRRFCESQVASPLRVQAPY